MYKRQSIACALHQLSLVPPLPPASCNEHHRVASFNLNWCEDQAFRILWLTIMSQPSSSAPPTGCRRHAQRPLHTPAAPDELLCFKEWMRMAHLQNLRHDVALNYWNQAVKHIRVLGHGPEGKRTHEECIALPAAKVNFQACKYQ